MQDQPDKNDKNPNSLFGEIACSVGRGIKEEGTRWLWWAGMGAAVGAVILGSAGFFLFGIEGLGTGVLAGAALGGGGALLFYLWASSGF